jgi:hypothetical protein
VATARRSRDPVEPGLEALRYRVLAGLLSACNLAHTQWASTDPAPSPFPFPFHHPKGAGISTLREGKKIGAHKTTLHCAKETALVGLRRSAVPRDRS